MGFAAALRRAGLAVTADRTSAFVQAVSLAGYDDRTATYWSGRATLCSSLDDNELYDRAFTAWFDASIDEVRRAGSHPGATATADRIDGRVGGGRHRHRRAASPRRASATEVLRHRDVAGLSEPDRARLALLFDHLDVAPPLRRALRRRPHRADRSTCVVRSATSCGPPASSTVRYRRPGVRPRRIVLLHRHLRLDAGLRRLAAPAGPPDRSGPAQPGRGLHHRDPAHPGHPSPHPAAARGGAGRGRPAGARLVRRDPAGRGDRRLPGRGAGAGWRAARSW